MPRKVLCLKGYRDHIRDENGKVLLYRPTYGSTASQEYTNCAEILAIGSGCKVFEPEMVGAWCVVPEKHNWLDVLSDGYMIFDERLFELGLVLPYIITP
jgi:hypothetical protein